MNEFTQISHKLCTYVMKLTNEQKVELISLILIDFFRYAGKISLFVSNVHMLFVHIYRSLTFTKTNIFFFTKKYFSF